MSDWRNFMNPDRRRFLRRSVMVIVLIFAAASELVGWAGAHYRIGIDLTQETCLPFRIYLVTFQANGVYGRGDYVAFIPKNHRMGEKFDGQLIAKEVAAVAGDRVEIRHDQLRINGAPKLYPMILLPKLGLPPGARDRVEEVPEGQLFVVGTLPRAFDSRYWGFLPVTEVIGKVTPIF